MTEPLHAVSYFHKRNNRTSFIGFSVGPNLGCKVPGLMCSATPFLRPDSYGLMRWDPVAEHGRHVTVLPLGGQGGG